MALQLEALLLSDSNGTTVEQLSSGLSVDVPSQELIAKQAKNILMPVQERNQRQRNRKIKSIPGRCNFSSNLVSYLTNIIVPPYPPGMKQVISGSKHDVLVNPRHPIRNCTLCRNYKSVTNCPRRAELKMSASEYVLTRDDCNVSLRFMHALMTCQ